MKILEVIRYLIEGGREKQFEADYERAAAYLESSPHCLSYRLARSEKERNRYLMLIEWDSASGHLEGFRRSADFREFYALVKPYFEMIEEMEHYADTGVEGHKPAGGER